MRENEFARWLKNSVSTKVNSDYRSRCRRVEKDLKTDLDAEYEKDNGKSLLEILTYTPEYENGGCPIYFSKDTNIACGLNSLKSGVNRYFRFCRNQK